MLVTYKFKKKNKKRTNLSFSTGYSDKGEERVFKKLW